MNRRTKVGFVTERMLLGFGLDLVVDKIAEGLKKNGHEVTVFTSITDGTYDSKEYSVELIPTPAMRFFPAYDLSALRWISKLNRENIDIFFVGSFPFFSAMPFLKTPCVAIDYGVSSTWGFPLHTKINFSYMKFTQQHFYFRRAKRIIAGSHFIKKELPSSVQKKTRVIYGGADHYQVPDDIEGKAASFRQEVGVEKDEVLLLYVGRLNPKGQPYKGVQDLFDIYRECKTKNPKIRMLMVGYGDEEDEKLIENRGIIPYIKAPVEMMPVFYAASDIYVTASRWEGLDLPAVEAQFFGKPVVVLELGAHPEVVKSGQGGFVLPSVEEFPEAILDLAGNEAKRLEMGRKAEEYVARFRWGKTAGAYAQLIQEVIS